MYDDQDRLTTYDHGGDVYSYDYTANGELLSKTGPDGVTSYVYDLLGALRSVTLADGTRIDYVIDPLERRVGKKVNGTPQWRLLYEDDLRPAAQLGGAGNLVSSFVYASGGTTPDSFTQGGHTYRIIADHLGSPRLVIDAASGAIAERIDYDAWGRVTRYDVLGPAGYLPIPFGFAGGIADEDTGLVRFGARDYDPSTGRWTSKDPNAGERLGQLGDVEWIMSEGANFYGYVVNDPVTFIDPNGRSKTKGILRGNDPFLKRLLEAGRGKNRAEIKAILREAKDLYDRGLLNPTRWKNIRAWAKLAKDGRLLGGLLIPCLDSVSCACLNAPDSCAELLDALEPGTKCDE